MLRSRRILHTSLAAALVVAGFACGGGTATVGNPATAAGTYVLESVVGRGPDDGTIVLTPDARAVRRVRYPGDALAAHADSFGIGTFRLPGAGVIEFNLRGDGGQSNFRWTFRGKVSGSELSVRYTDPANGTSVSETYRRK